MAAPHSPRRCGSTPACWPTLAKLVPLAPLHQPHNLAPIQAIADAAPHMPQVACFDTAFHRTQPPLAQAFALPRALHRRRACGATASTACPTSTSPSRLREIAPELAAGRVVIAHLGNGASLCAVQDGRSVASTMGFTAVDGLMMGTRCGALDPGVLLYLMDEHGMDAAAIEDLIYRKSACSASPASPRTCARCAASADPRRREAIALFVYRIVREIGSLAAALGGIDGLVFTAGIGENDAATRAEVAAGCGWLGLELDAARNTAGDGRISAALARRSRPGSSRPTRSG